MHLKMLDKSPRDLNESHDFVREQHHGPSRLCRLNHLCVPFVGKTKVVTKNVTLLDINPQVVTVVVAQASERIDAYPSQLLASTVNVLEGVANRLRRSQLCGFLDFALLPKQIPVNRLEVGLQGCHDILVSVAKQPETQLRL